MVCQLQLLTILSFLLQEDNKNFITLIAKHGSEMLVCGTGACNPTCWHLVSWSSSVLLCLVSFPVDSQALWGMLHRLGVGLKPKQSSGVLDAHVTA